MTFPFPAIPPIISPEITFLGAFSTSASGLSIGNARSDRIVVVAAQREDDTVTTCPLPRINGANPTVVYQGVEADNMCLAYLAVPTGTTVSITNGQIRTAAWLVTGVTELDQAINNSGTGTSITLSGTMPSRKGAFIAIARSRSNMGSSSVSSSGQIGTATKDTSSTSGGGTSGWVAGSALTLGAGSGSFTLSQTNNYFTGIAAGGVFI